MADFYMDTDGGSDANNGTTWALAKATLEGLLAVMSAGDRGFIQGATVDTAASARTFTSPGTLNNPCRLIGVKDGTTNEPPLPSDIAVIGTDTLPRIETTGSGSHITIGGRARVVGIDIVGADRTLQTGGWIIQRSRVGANGSLRGESTFIDSTIQMDGSGVFFADLQFRNVTWIINATVPALFAGSNNAPDEFFGCDFTQGTGSITALYNNTASRHKLFANCKMPSTYSLLSAVTTQRTLSVEVIQSSDVTGKSSGSIEDYLYEDAYGTIEAEFTKVRTGGAPFSLCFDPHTDATLEGAAALRNRRPMTVWIEGDGTPKTITVHIANDGAGDLVEGDVWLEVLTPDSGGTAQHDYSVDPDFRNTAIGTATAITDDTGSTWGGSVGNHQKLEVTVSPAFEGYVHVHVNYAKRNGDPLYVDWPEVT